MTGSKKIIIGLVGESGSGKDTVADYLRDKHGAKLYRFADPLREALELYLDHISREDLQWLAMRFKERFGKEILSRGLKRKIEKNGSSLIVINGVRFFEDAEFIKSLPNGYVLYITLDSKSRWERIYSRGEKSDDAVSYEKFLEMEQAPTEVQVPEIGKNADFRVENTGTKEELLAKMGEIVHKLQDA
jgi:dephospho-CoA kinase